MANDDIPSIPLPPSAAVPPIESAPVPPTPPAAAAPAPYGYPGYAAPQAYAPVPAGPPTGLSLASMITGIAGLVLFLVGFGFPPAVAAVILGHIGQKRQPYARGFWLTGLITGYIGVGLSLLSLVVLIVILVAAAITGYSAFEYYNY